MNADNLFDLCIKEIELVQDNIRRYDQNGLTIKSWCVTTWSLVTIYAIQNANVVVAAMGFVIVIAFGFMEFIYRRFQYRFMLRASAIESLLKHGDLDKYEFSMNKTAAAVNVTAELKYALRQPQFQVFYFCLFALSVLLILYLDGSGIAKVTP